MKIKEFFNAGYKIKRKANIELETIIGVGTDEETGKINELKQIRPYEVSEDNSHNWFIIENKDGRIVELFEEKTAGTNKSLEQVEKDIIKYIENMPSPKKEWELDKDKWHDLLSLSSSNKLTKKDIRLLNEKLKEVLETFSVDMDWTKKRVQEIVLERFRMFDNLNECFAWHFEVFGDRDIDCLIQNVLNTNSKNEDGYIVLDVQDLLPNETFEMSNSQVLYILFVL